MYFQVNCTDSEVFKRGGRGYDCKIVCFINIHEDVLVIESRLDDNNWLIEIADIE